MFRAFSSSVGLKVKRDWEHNGKVWIDGSCFSFCWNKIWRWLDLGSMLGLLMKHEIVQDEEDFFQINNANKSPRERANNLLMIVRNGGDVSFYLLYMCIRDDSGNPLGHKDAVKELVTYGEHYLCNTVASGFVMSLYNP